MYLLTIGATGGAVVDTLKNLRVPEEVGIS
jgi:hypothetical protein